MSNPLDSIQSYLHTLSSTTNTHKPYTKLLTQKERQAMLTAASIFRHQSTEEAAHINKELAHVLKDVQNRTNAPEPNPLTKIGKRILNKLHLRISSKDINESIYGRKATQKDLDQILDEIPTKKRTSSGSKLNFKDLLVGRGLSTDLRGLNFSRNKKTVETIKGSGEKPLRATERLKNIDFSDINFSNCKFEWVNISSSDFNNCKFTDCLLKNTIANDSSFKNTQFIDSNLDDCWLGNSQVDECQIKNCSLKTSNLQGSTLTKTTFENCDLERASFLDTKASASRLENCNCKNTALFDSGIELDRHSKKSHVVNLPTISILWSAEKPGYSALKVFSRLKENNCIPVKIDYHPQYEGLSPEKISDETDAIIEKIRIKEQKNADKIETLEKNIELNGEGINLLNNNLQEVEKEQGFLLERLHPKYPNKDLSELTADNDPDLKEFKEITQKRNEFRSAIKQLKSKEAALIKKKEGLVEVSIAKKVLEVASEHPEEYPNTNLVINTIKKNAKKFDGIIIPGGADLEPKYYREFDSNISNSEPDERRTILEFALLSAHEKLGIPVMGICRGAQTANVYFGGSLDQSVSGHMRRIQPLTPKDPDKGGIIRGTLGNVRGISFHRQGITKVGAGLDLVTSYGGVAKSLEGEFGSPLILTQFHPEFSGDRSGWSGSIVDSILSKKTNKIWTAFTNSADTKRKQRTIGILAKDTLSRKSTLKDPTKIQKLIRKFNRLDGGK